MNEPKFEAADAGYKQMETTESINNSADSGPQEDCSPEVLRRLEELGYIDAGLDI